MIAASLLQRILGLPLQPPKPDHERELIRRESQYGTGLFGPVPAGVRREFFCLDRTTWVWHEEWTDQAGRRQVMNTRYEVRPTGVLKIQDGGRYQHVKGAELQNLAQATREYYTQVARGVYGRQLAA